MPPGVRTARGVVYAATFVSFIDNFAMLPTVAPYARALGAEAAGVGVAVATYSMANVPGNILGGVLADRLGRRRVAVWGIVAAAVALACYPLAGGLGSLLAVRAVHGVAGGVHVVALFTLAGDLAPEGGRGRVMGRMGAVIGVAAVLAPALAGLVRQAAGFTATFATVAIVMAAGAGMLAARAGEAPAPGPGISGGRGRLPRDARARLLTACVAVFGFTTGFGVLAGFLPDRVEGAGAPAAASGALFTVLALVAVGLMLSRAASRADRGNPGLPMAVGLGLISAALWLLAGTGSVPAAVAASGLFGAGFGIVFPAATGAAAGAPADTRGRALGVFNGVYSIGFIVGPPLAGVASQLGTSPFTVAAVAAGASLVLVLALSPRLARGAPPARVA